MADNKIDVEAREKAIKLLKRRIICLETSDCAVCPFSGIDGFACDESEENVDAYLTAIHDIEDHISKDIWSVKNENENN